MASTAMTVMYIVAGATLILATVLPHPSTLNTPVLVMLASRGVSRPERSIGRVIGYRSLFSNG